MRLRERKRRYGKPLAVMVRDLDAARALCTLTAEEEALLANACAAHCAWRGGEMTAASRRA